MKKKTIKTINFRILFWFCSVFAIGAVAVSLMSYSVISKSVYIVWPMYLGIALFGAFGIVGLMGMIVLLRKYFILKYVLKYGTETIGEYVDLGRTISWRNSSRYYGHGRITTWFNQIIFKYTVDGKEREYKSCTVYIDKQLDELKELKTFTVKYKGKHAIICEKV